MKRTVALEHAVEAVSQKIAPLWPLSHFVAVNPFQGFADQPFSEVAFEMSRLRGADMVPSLSWFRNKYEDGTIGHSDLQAVCRQIEQPMRTWFAERKISLSSEKLISLLDLSEEESEPYPTCSFSLFLDARMRGHWQLVIREEVAKWCAAYDDEGQSSWKFPWKHLGFYAAWKEAAALDYNADLNGLEGFRNRVASFPETAEAAIMQALNILEVPEHAVEEFFYRMLMVLPGWAGYFRYQDREVELHGGKGVLLPQLLAVLLNYEVALFEQHAVDTNIRLGWKRHLMEYPTNLEAEEMPVGLQVRLLWQRALEHAFQVKVSSQIEAQDSSTNEEEPWVQAAFCIDVRSEILRRHLEQASPSVQTYGMAGFFGVPLAHQDAATGRTQSRCPVLLAPNVASSSDCCGHHHGDEATLQRESLGAWKRFKEAAASCFTYVETLGLTYAVTFVRKAFAKMKPHKPTEEVAMLSDLPVEQKATMAKGILMAMGIQQPFAPIVLLCGHGASTENNPYASGLECGACGGHAGDANARVAAQLLNDQGVRAALAKDGLIIPEKTRFVAGLHNTTLDEITLLGSLEEVDTDALRFLKNIIRQAGKMTRLERAGNLGLAREDVRVHEKIRKRSVDWSQVRPEWGLAGNTSFVLAPRTWTKEADFGGQVFLHDYNANSDSEGKLLEAIMGGPVVVASWINLQYYASTVDQQHFGSGHKSIHNVVGGIGVALGNENDLRTGLPWQSVHNGESDVHLPVRLQVFVAADREQIDEILMRQKHLRELIENEWIYLYSLGKDGTHKERCHGVAKWGKPASTPSGL